jgi:hypothetical protein
LLFSFISLGKEKVPENVFFLLNPIIILDVCVRWLVENIIVVMVAIRIFIHHLPLGEFCSRSIYGI